MLVFKLIFSFVVYCHAASLSCSALWEDGSTKRRPRPMARGKLPVELLGSESEHQSHVMLELTDPTKKGVCLRLTSRQAISASKTSTVAQVRNLLKTPNEKIGILHVNINLLPD